MVKPTWLLTTTCTVPPTVKPRACDIWNSSITTPWPAKAASPWISTGITCLCARSWRRSWRARTEPATTGSTISRCEGLNASARCTGPPGVAMSALKPMWYLTSPECSGVSGWSNLPSNSANSFSVGLPSVLISTLSRPRWAMPTTTSLTPPLPPRRTSVSISGIRESPPSSEKRFCPTYLLPRKRSSPSAAVSRSSTRRLSSGDSPNLPAAPSRRCCIQCRCGASAMCMNSAPMCPL